LDTKTRNKEGLLLSEQILNVGWNSLDELPPIHSAEKQKSTKLKLSVRVLLKYEHGTVGTGHAKIDTEQNMVVYWTQDFAPDPSLIGLSVVAWAYATPTKTPHIEQ
jgi:hypothetical protein